MGDQTPPSIMILNNSAIKNFTTTATSRSNLLDDLFQNAFFIISLVILILMNLVAIVANFLLLLVLRKSNNIHRNPRIVLGNLSVSTICATIYLIVKNGYTLIVIRQPEKLWIPSGQICCFIEGLFTIPAQITILTSFVICAERLLATIAHKSYENKSPVCIVTGLLTIWTIALLIKVRNIAQTLPDKPILLYCNVMMQTNHTLKIYAYSLYMFVEVLSIFIFIYVIKRCRHRLTQFAINRAQLNLASRWLLRQNIEVTEALLPSAVLHVVCVSLACFVQLHHLDESDEEHTANIKELLIVSQYVDYLTMSVIFSLHPMLIIGRLTTFRQKFKDIICNKQSRAFIYYDTQADEYIVVGDGYAAAPQRENSTHEANIRFKALEDMWNKKYASSNRDSLRKTEQH